MTTIHEAYAPPEPPAPVPFTGTRSELTGGEYLGNYSQPHLFGPGDVVTGIGDGRSPGAYYYDPELRIEGNSFVMARLPDSILGWRGIARGLDPADAPEPPAPDEAPLCQDEDEPEGTRFPCGYCAEGAKSCCVHSDENGRESF